MPDNGIFVSWQEVVLGTARVARSSFDYPTLNTLTVRPPRSFAFWVSPTQCRPAKGWRIYAASVPFPKTRFAIGPDSKIRWEHAIAGPNGSIDLSLVRHRTYAFFLSVNDLTRSDLLDGRHLPWPVSLQIFDNRPNDVYLCFPPPPMMSDPHAFHI